MVDYSHADVEQIIANLGYARADALVCGLSEVVHLTEVAIAAAEDALEAKIQSECSGAATKRRRTA